MPRPSMTGPRSTRATQTLRMSAGAQVRLRGIAMHHPPTAKPGNEEGEECSAGDSARLSDEQVHPPSAACLPHGGRDAGFLTGSIEAAECLIDHRFHSARDRPHHAGDA